VVSVKVTDLFQMYTLRNVEWDENVELSLRKEFQRNGCGCIL